MPAIFNGISILNRRGASGPNGSPSNLVLTVISATENQLDWLNGATNEDNVIIQRSDDGGSYLNLVTLAAGTITYTDTTAILGYLHYYRIVLIKGLLYSAYSNAVNNLTGDITTGKVGEWLLNENAGTTATDTGGANNGTIVGADWTTGIVGGALNFNGIANNDVVNLGDILDTTFAGAGKKFTITVRFKPSVSNMTNNVIVAKTFAGANGREWTLTIGANNKIRFSWYGATDGSSVRVIEGSTLINNVNKWYHLRVTYDQTVSNADNKVELYVDHIIETRTVAATSGSPISIPDLIAYMGIGAAIQSDNTTSTQFFDGFIDYVRIFNVLKTYADSLSDYYYNFPIPESTAQLYSYDAGQVDMFFDDLYSSLKTGSVVRTINNPAKYSGNPIFVSGDNNDTWDYQKTIPQVISGSPYKMLYGAVSNTGATPGYYLQCYATSADGILWTKPNLGIVSWDGNTNNNLIIADGAIGMWVYDNPDGSPDMRYIGSIANYPEAGGEWNTNRRITLYKSADLITWTQINQFYPTGSPYLEGGQIIKRADGKWVVYYIWYGLVDSRRVGAFLSDTTDPAGTWTDQGTVINTTVSTDQKYQIGIALIDDLYIVIINNYNSTTGLIWTDLYYSRDALLFGKKNHQWIKNGSSGSWDSGMVEASGLLNKIGDFWRMYYTGINKLHTEAGPYDGREGYVSIGYKRIGSLIGSGTYTTTAFTPTEPLMINADITTGTLQVELLLAADNSVIAGYSKDDMDALGAIDTYSHEVTWGGNSIPTDTSLRSEERRVGKECRSRWSPY